jgi:hypothetical protein
LAGLTILGLEYLISMIFCCSRLGLFTLIKAGDVLDVIGFTPIDERDCCCID